MTTEKQLLELCLSFENVYEDHPFRGKQNYCVVRHRSNKKIFALIYKKDDKIWVNLKCEPLLGDFLRRSHSAIIPAYHMNKVHWISVILDDTIPDAEIELFVSNSYSLTQ